MGQKLRFFTYQRLTIYIQIQRKFLSWKKFIWKVWWCILKVPLLFFKLFSNKTTRDSFLLIDTPFYYFLWSHISWQIVRITVFQKFWWKWLARQGSIPILWLIGQSNFHPIQIPRRAKKGVGELCIYKKLLVQISEISFCFGGRNRSHLWQPI